MKPLTLLESQTKAMEELYEKFRWHAWREHKKQIIDLYGGFDLNDWDFIRSAIDSWIDTHIGDWCDYAIKNYRKPEMVAVSDERQNSRKDLA